MIADPPVGIVFLRHEEFGGSRVGHARYDPNTEYFTCRTCGFERAARDVGQCSVAGCLGRLRYNRPALVCGEHPEHVFPMEAGR